MRFAAGLRMTLKLLLANEFGGGHGHYVQLQSLGRALKDAVPDVAVKIVMPPATRKWVPSNELFPLEQPDCLASQATMRVVPSSHAQHIALIFLRHPEFLAARLRYWQQQFAEFKPDVVVGDYAPSLTMAARGRVASVALGSGYSLPPPEADVSTPFREPFGIGPLETEEVILAKLNAILVASGTRPLARLPQMNEATGYALRTIAIFDPYWEIRTQDYLGVEQPSGSPRPVPQVDNTVLAYFSVGVSNPAIIEGMKLSGLPVKLFVGKDRAEAAEQARGSRIEIVDSPFDLPRDLPGHGLTMGQGSLGFVAASLFAGLPQVALYKHDEGWSIAKALHKAQIGLSAFEQDATADQVAEMMLKAANRVKMRNYALALSDRYAEFRDNRSLPKLVNIVR